jgi:hypothetical protein
VSYEGLGFYGGKPPKESNRGLLIAVVIAAVAVIGVAATLLFVEIKDTTPGSALPAAAGTATKSNDPLQPRASGTPKVAGWKVVPINNGGSLVTDKAYDVPPAWEALPRLASFGEDANTMLVTPASYMRGFCPGSPNAFRSMAGLLTVSRKGEPGTTATAAAHQVAEAVYTINRVKPTVDVGDTQEVTVLSNKRGTVVTADVKVAPAPGDPCAATSGIVAVMVIESQAESGDVAMVAFGDQGFPEATSEQDLKQIVTSFHVFG